jgi:hypothetical protein
MNIFSAEEDHQNMKDVGLLLNIIYHLSQSLSSRFSSCEHIMSWLEKLCREQNIGRNMCTVFVYINDK